MEYGRFMKNGAEYEILTPHTPSPWANYLFNDEYFMEVTQTLQGAGSIVGSDTRTPCIGGSRYFYLYDKESGEVWNPNYVPLKKKPDFYSCVHGMWRTRLTSSQQGIETRITAMVPPQGSKEIWIIQFRNRTDRIRRISCCSAFGFFDHGVMGGDCVYDENSQIIFKHAFPYHTLYEEKEKAEREKAYYYFFSDRTPDSCEMSRQRFFGVKGETEIPEGILRGRLSCINGEAEDFMGVFSHSFTLEPGGEQYLCLAGGASSQKEEVLSWKQGFSKGSAERIWKETEGFWEKKMNSFQIETPDPGLNYFGNYWLKKQVALLTRQNRGTPYCPVRNQLQDAFGYALLDPEGAKEYIFKALALQRRDGFIHQWHYTDGTPPKGLCLLHHTDGPLWLVICAEALIRQNGKKEMLMEKLPYADGEEDTLLGHLTAALLYMGKNLGSHGLCLMGDGDWNDPINGVGRLGKGESVWSSMALIYAIKLLLPYLRDQGRMEEEPLSRLREELEESVNTYGWGKSWYLAAVHDDGKPVGDPDDRLFLNTQSWGILSGTAKGERLRMVEGALKRLETPCGPLILSPPFEGWDGRWGRISVKKSGTTENGSVYCHSSMFLAYAQAVKGDGNAFYEILKRTLPVNAENPPERNLQLPLYLPNYYYGLRDSPNFGRSSLHYGTGSAAWMLMLLVEVLAGVRAEAEGLTVKPCIPDHWNEMFCTRKYKEAEYHIHIVREEKEYILADGVLTEGRFLPYEAGRRYQIYAAVKGGGEQNEERDSILL